MSLGNSLFQARKKSGLSQERVSEYLGVSRQTISKWECDETLPDITQAKRLASLYHTSLDDLIDFDLEVNELTEMIRHTSTETQNKVDWNQVWAEQYPILSRYRQEVDTAEYERILQGLLDRLHKEYGYDELDSFLVCKDILASLWQKHNH
ncbi:MAG: helix-turn-helix transcriptional regulator [Erysipelotrichaceae bacterium]|nr:helix-turn-helix transcriptional regulator [Erysipelotrichaceae bacterium]MCI9313071.1 helix-turn-helix transcriptional regulator [Erysipelotrichaceae bacterium]